MTRRKIALLLATVLTLAACTGGHHKAPAAVQANQAARQDAQQVNKELTAPKIINHMDYQNFYGAQELYDDPSTIIWCTTTWGNANSPLVTVPVRGKLTSSSVSMFPGQQIKSYYQDDGTYNPELPSTDGMYHGNPPPYRYGFTPGGQYVDFFNMATFCTTDLTKFQREGTKVSVSIDPAVAAAQTKAEADLRQCNAHYDPKDAAKNKAACAAAQADLEAVLGK